MRSYISISVVIVSWNVKELVSNCIESLLKNEFKGNLEIIVVDNASSDGTVSYLEEKYASKIILIANTINVGFAKANNQAFKISGGDTIFILNPDTIVRPRALQNLLNALNETEDVGMIGPKMILPNEEIDKACARVFPSLSRYVLIDIFRFQQLPGIGKYLKAKYVEPYNFDKPQKVEAIKGAAMFISKGLLNHINGFFEGYLHGGEDLELCHSVREAKYYIHYNPAAEIIHYDKGSSKKAKVRIAINANLSMYLFFKRTRGKAHAFIYKWLIRLVYVPLLYIFSFVRYLLGKLTKEEWNERKKISITMLLWKPIYRD